MEVGHWGMKVPRPCPILQALGCPLGWPGSRAQGHRWDKLGHSQPHSCLQKGLGCPGDHISQGFCSPNSCDGMAENY